jgi:hypothetical protein
MTKRERIHSIIARQASDRSGFWLGNPHADSWPGLHRFFGTQSENELRRQVGDDFAWIRLSCTRRAATTTPWAPDVS